VIPWWGFLWPLLRQFFTPGAVRRNMNWSGLLAMGIHGGFRFRPFPGASHRSVHFPQASHADVGSKFGAPTHAVTEDEKELRG